VNSGTQRTQRTQRAKRAERAKRRKGQTTGANRQGGGPQKEAENQAIEFKQVISDQFCMGCQRRKR